MRPIRRSRAIFSKTCQNFYPKVAPSPGLSLNTPAWQLPSSKYCCRVVINNSGFLDSKFITPSLSDAHGTPTLLPPCHSAIYFSLCCQVCSATSKINHKSHLCPHRCPFTPGWREAIIAQCLAQGHKCHDWDSNPQPDDIAASARVRCTALWKSSIQERDRNSASFLFLTHTCYLHVISFPNSRL